MAKNYYVILGIPYDANPDQIKSAYRLRVKELHPDYYGQDSEPFRMLQEAYSVLSDPERRRRYDAELEEAHAHKIPVEVHKGPFPAKPSPIVPLGPFERPRVEEVFLTRSFETFSPSFEEIFARLRRNFTGAGRSKSERIANLSVVIPLSPAQALQGGEARIMVPVSITCPRCRGRGGIGWFECWRCRGHGKVDDEVPISVPYPAGLAHDHTVGIPLDRFGIDNFYLTVHFRITDEP